MPSTLGVELVGLQEDPAVDRYTTGLYSADVEPMVIRESVRAGALETGLDVLEALSRERSGLGVTELARRIGRDKANIHRQLRHGRLGGRHLAPGSHASAVRPLPPGRHG